MAYKMRGGVLMDEALADSYDRNRQADIDAVRAILPEARILEASQGQIVFQLEHEGKTWVGQMCLRDAEGWVYRK
jgi:hypothetical protein